MSIKHVEIPVPENMSSLPMTDRGYLKPWFVEGDDFRIVDKIKAKSAIGKEACWICGNPFDEDRYALVGSPLSAMVRNFREPPCHVECAEYAVQVCPFLLYPSAKRRYAGLDDSENINEINKFIDVKTNPDNPGEHYIVVVNDFEFDEKKFLITCYEDQVLERQYWIRGVRQEFVPDPIVEYSELPEYIRNELVATGQVKFEYELALETSVASGEILPVTTDKFLGTRWKQPRSFTFAANLKLVKITAQEVSHAVHHLPLAFIVDNGALVLVAILGITPQGSLVVDEEGNWKPAYIPDLLKAYPFQFGISPDTSTLLCLDGGSDLLIDSGSVDAEDCFSFFSDEGIPTPELISVQKNMALIAQGFSHSSRISEQLGKSGIVKPWPVTISGSDGQEIRVNGLHQIDESKLNTLGADTVLELRDTGALLVAYSQLLSMEHLVELCS